MKLKLNQQNSEDMIVGASLYSTGGGFPYDTQKEKFKVLFEKQKNMELINYDELGEDDMVCTAYGVGSAAQAEGFDLSQSAQKALAVIEKMTGKQVKAIFAGETNIEAIMFETASEVGLPVLDADCTGGRAVPEIQFDNVCISGKSILPLVMVTAHGEVIVLAETANNKQIEDFVRAVAVRSQSSVLVIDHVMSAKDAKALLTNDVMVRSIKVGAFIREKDPTVDEIISFMDAKKIFTGKVSKVEWDTTKNTGFIDGFFFVEDGNGNTAKIFVKNENMALWINDKPELTIPDLITVIDNKRKIGLHNSQTKVGMEVTIVGIPATDLWRSDRGIKAFNPRLLGQDIEPVLLQK